MDKRIALLFLGLLLAARPCTAASSIAARIGEVWLGSRLVLRVHPQEADKLVANRLEKAILQGMSPPQISVRRQGTFYTVYGGKVPIITATPFRARLNGTSPGDLASLWARKLQEALSRESYLVAPSRMVIPVGEVRTLRVAGRYRNALGVSIENEKVADLARSEMPVALKGIRAGTTQVEISSGNLRLATQIIVKDYAGFVPRNTALVVTGKQISSGRLRRLLLDSLEREIRRKRDARVELYLPPDPLRGGISSGETLTFSVTAKVTGKEYLPTKGVVGVSIQSRPFSTPSPSAFLLVSNNPENFSKPGRLFRGVFPEIAPARVFFHHHNRGTTPYWFVLEISNESVESAEVHVLEGIGGPDENELLVGEQAAESFFLAYRDGVGRIVRVESQGAHRLVQKKVRPGESISGILQLTPLSATRPYLEARIESYDFKAPERFLPEEERKSKGIFPSPDILVDADYTVGGDFAFIPIGKHGILADPETGRPDRGNYGALYTIQLTLRNPNPEPSPVNVVFSPLAGPARGVFLLDGTRLLTTPVISASTSFPLLTLDLMPGEERKVVLQTIPLGGSFYPVHLVAGRDAGR